MLTRSLAQSMYHTKYLIERDALSACFIRMGCGFCTPSTMSEAKVRINNIQTLLNNLEHIKDLPKNSPVYYDQGCCEKK